MDFLPRFNQASGHGVSLVNTKQEEKQAKTTKRGEHMKRWPRIGGKDQNN